MHVRSLLYVPADRPAMLEKAHTRGADAVIVDLEDAVAHDKKDDARDAAGAYVQSKPGTQVVVRVNSGELLGHDVEAVAHPGLSAVTLAKAETFEQVKLADMILFRAEEAYGLPHGTFELFCLIETAQGVRNAYEMASHPRVTRLGLGEADLGADIGISHTAHDDIWAPIRSRIVVDSAAAGIDPPVAPVSTDFADLQGLSESTRHLQASGFGARAAIHPAQVPVINEVLTPSPEAIANARRLIEQYERSLASGDAVFVDERGRMVDEAVIRHARRIAGSAGDAT